VMLSRPDSSSSSLLMLPPHRWRRRAPVKTATRAATDFFIGNLISYQWIDKVGLAGYLLLCSRCLGDVVVAARRCEPHLTACARTLACARAFARSRSPCWPHERRRPASQPRPPSTRRSAALVPVGCLPRPSRWTIIRSDSSTTWTRSRRTWPRCATRSRRTGTTPRRSRPTLSALCCG